jgi:hypothetical protein
MADDFEKELSKSEKLLKERLTKAGKIARDITNQAFKELLVTIDDYSNSLDNITDQLASQLQDYDKIKKSTAQFGDALKSTLPFVRDNKDLASKLTQIYSENNKLANKLVENNEDLITGQLRSQDIAKNIAKSRQNQLTIELSQRDIAQEIIQSEKEIVGLQGEELEKTQSKLEALREINEQLEAEKENQQAISNNLQEQAASAAKIETKVGIGGKILQGFKKIPVLGDILDVGGAEEAMRSAAAGGANGFKTMGAGVKALGPSLKAAMGPLALISLAVEAIQMLIGAMFEADTRITALSKNLQISKEEAQGIDGYFKSIKGSLETQYNLTKEIYQAQAELSELSATSTLYAKETLDAQIQLTKEYGLQAQDAANLNKIFITNDEVATDALDTAAETTSQFFKQTGILFNERKLLEQASKVSGQLLVSFKGSTAELIKAVAQANKLGITLEQAKGISESMLDFEQSISAELEAELLTGKDLNLDKARSLALQGKFAEAAEEALKSAGSLEEFSQMNVIQQQALAKAAGLTVDQLSDALIQQKLVTKESQSQFDRLSKAGQDELARRFALGEADAKEIEAANKRLDAQEKFNLSMDKVKEVFTDLVDGGALDAIADAAKAVADTIASGGSLFSLFGKSDLTKNLEKKSLETAKQTEDELIKKQKTGEKLSTGESERLKKAQDRLEEEKSNTVTASNISSARYQQELNQKDLAANKNQTIKAKDFTIQTLPEDTVIAAGGTNLGRSDEMVTLLKDLLTATKAGGNIYLETDKVGTAHNKSTFKLNK